jgi:hypothetical protein
MSSVIVPRPERGYLPRTYQVPGEPFAVKFWTGIHDVAYQLNPTEVDRLFADLADEVMRRKRELERGANRIPADYPHLRSI